MTFPAQLPIPSEVLKIAKKLEDAGFETWCVTRRPGPRCAPWR